jgi:hypothetical protein
LRDGASLRVAARLHPITSRALELSESIARRLDRSPALLIRAEDVLGWSEARILAYYRERGVNLDA